MNFKQALLLFFGFFALGAPVFAEGEVRVYTSRQKSLIGPILEGFTKETGVSVKLLYVPKGIAEKVIREGRSTRADLVIATDVGEVAKIARKGMAAEVSSSALRKNIPAPYRDENSEWFGISLRARVIYASKERVPRGSVRDYSDLAGSGRKGKICIRSGKHPYNVSLFSAMIAGKGAADTREWLKGVKANLARKPQGNDREQVRSIYAGLCDLSIGNSYYFGLMYFNEKEPAQKKWADAVYIIAPGEGGGTYVNVSAMTLPKHSKNKKAAVKLMEYLVGDDAQTLYAELNYEFPVKADVPISDFFKEFIGEFKPAPIPLKKVAENIGQASRLVDEVRFDL